MSLLENWLEEGLVERRAQARRELDREELIKRLASKYHDHKCIGCGDEWLCEGGCDRELPQICEGCVVR